LQELNLAKNCIGPQGAKLLGAGLQANAAAAAVAARAAGGRPDSQQDGTFDSNSSDNINGFIGLRYLELEWCKLKVEGVAHLAAALVMQRQGRGAAAAKQQQDGAHCCLQRLGLCRNGAGDKGVKVRRHACATTHGSVQIRSLTWCMPHMREAGSADICWMHGAMHGDACCTRLSIRTWPHIARCCMWIGDPAQHGVYVFCQAIILASPYITIMMASSYYPFTP
jgi:hypothetical protein